jgi:molecular chaperone DnaJ
MVDSYFAILGVTSKSSQREIQSAYRRLAKEFHPDRDSGDSESFRRIQEAYAVLANPARRSAYERSLPQRVFRRDSATEMQPAPEPLIPEPLIPEARAFDLGEISPIGSFRTFSPSAEEIIDWLASGFLSARRAKSGDVRSLTLEVTLTREQARRGGTATVRVPARGVCPSCRGYGGSGYHECLRCGGEGVVAGEVPVAVSFPAGLAGDHAVVIPMERFGIDNVRLTVLFRARDLDMI